jgi:hypothetical protein
MLFNLLEDVSTLNEMFTRNYTEWFGPRLCVRGPSTLSLAEGYVIVLDIDNQWGEFTLCDYDEWHETGLGRAALAYAQCCGWDVSPGEAGIWVCYYVPNESCGG